MDIREMLKQRRVFFDGGTGTLLQGYGLKPGEAPERFNITNPRDVTETHRLYLEAGSDIITSNSLGAYTINYPDARHLIEAAMENARNALAGGGGKIAFDMGPTGRFLKPAGDLGFEDCYNYFREAARAAVECGADLIIIETMTDLYELKAAALAAKETGLPVFATMTFDERGRTLTGADPACMAALLEGLGVDALGMNCGYGPGPYEKLLPELLTALPIILQPNAGLPVMENGAARYDLPPEDYARYMSGMAERGVRVLGGCCGTTPAHIRAMVNLCAERNLIENAMEPPALAPGAVVCSGVKSVRLDLGRLPSVARCKETDPDGLADEALELAETADIVEITVTEPDTVLAVQTLTRAPLSLRADDAEVLLAAARVYNGRPMVAGGPFPPDMENALKRYGAVKCPF